MKKQILKISLITFLATIGIMSCKKKENEENDNTSTDITYSAAYVVNGGSNSISVIDLTTNEVKRTIDLMPSMWPHHIYLNVEKTKIAIGVPGMDLSAGHNINTTGMTGQFLVLDSKTGTKLGSQNTAMMNHNAIFSPDGKEIWTSQMDSMGTVLVYDATTFSLKNTIAVGMMPAEVTFSADGLKAFVANGMSDNVSVINVSTKSVTDTIPVGMEPVGAWPGSDNKMYVDNEEGQSISIIDVTTLTVVETVSLGFMPGMAAYNGGMNELWVSDPSNGKVHWYSRMGNMWMHGGEITTGAGAHAIAFNGMKAYVTNQMAASVSVVDVMGHSVIKTITVGTKPNGIVLKP